MEANELRLGNFIHHCTMIHGVVLPLDYIKQVRGITRNGVDLTLPSDEQNYFLEFNWIVPIKLTEEILFKSGFGEVGIYNNVFHKENFRIVIGNESCLFQIHEDGSCVGIEIYSLHQLQNLYFALTGKELDVNL